MSSFESDAHVKNVAEVFLKDILKTDQVQHGKESTLFNHLYATAALLALWGEDKPVCYAGLFHSIYGTSQFNYVTVPIVGGRQMVKNVIGERAEELAFLFCIADRSQFPWAVREAKALYTIEAANLIEQKDRAEWVARLLPWLTGGAREHASLYVGSFSAR